MPIHHVAIKTMKYAAVSKFYEAALSTIGFKVYASFDNPGIIGYTDREGPSFWIYETSEADKVAGGLGAHVAFECKSKEEVEAFHTLAIAAGGKNNGAPGYRQYSTPGYYAAYVLDPDGRNIEALHIVPQESASSETE